MLLWQMKETKLWFISIFNYLRKIIYTSTTIYFLMGREDNNEKEAAEEFFKLVVEFRHKLKDYLNSDKVQRLLSERKYQNIEDGIIKLRKDVFGKNEVAQVTLLEGYIDAITNRYLLIRILGILYNIFDYLDSVAMNRTEDETL